MLKFENVHSFHPFHPKTVISHLKALFQAGLHLFKVILKSTLSDLGLRALTNCQNWLSRLNLSLELEEFL